MNKENIKKFKELWSNPKYKALIKLGIYLFLIFAISAFVGINNRLSKPSSYPKQEEKPEHILNSITNNYSYNCEITIYKDDNINKYYYLTKTYDDNSIITKKYLDKEEIYYLSLDKYYQLKEDNYLKVSSKEIYDVIDYKYLAITTIKEYLNNTFSDGKYQIPINKIIDTNSLDYITIEVDNNSIIVDYTNLFIKDYDKVIVKLEYNDINNIKIKDVTM